MDRIWICDPILAMLLSPVTFAEWEQLEGMPDPYECYGGSGMAYGPVDGTDYIWLLYGDPPDDHGYFARYDIDSDDWEALERMPQEPEHTDWGGALTYVPDPFAVPASGWLFAIKGNGTSEFWCYNPSSDEWLECPDLEIGTAIPADGGAALCFGGYGEHEGLGYAYIYAFCGGGDNGRFFRYRFTVSPYDEDGGEWEELTSLGYYVDRGGALVWCELPDSPTYTKGMVYAVRGDDSHALYKYNPVSTQWSHVINMTYDVGSGGALAPGADGWSFFGFFGDSGDEWFYYDVDASSIVYFDEGDSSTWGPQHAGTAIAYDGEYVYAEVGTDDGEFHRYEYPESFGGGGQSSAVGTGGMPGVTVRSGGHAYTFLVSGAKSQPVRFRVVAADGRICHCGVTSVGVGQAALVWNHDGATPGVYLYQVTVDGRQTSGKLMVVK